MTEKGVVKNIVKQRVDVELLETRGAGTCQAVHRFLKTRVAVASTTNTNVSPLAAESANVT